MNNIARLAIERPLYPWVIVFVCVLGGVYGIDTVGRLEDPQFPIKNAYIITTYPGASAVEVEQEITDVIEASLQELPYLDFVTSKSVPGRSEILVQMLEEYAEGDLPQIYDELRRRVIEAGGRLPPGTGVPIVEDDYGDVYGMLYAVTAPGYSEADIFDMSRQISNSLKMVTGVAKVATAGEPLEAIFVEVDHERLVRLGLPIDAVFSSIAQENQVVGAGSVAYGQRRIRFAPALAFHDVQAVGDMRIGRPGSTEIIRLSDVATISRGPVEVPPQIIRFNSERVFTVGVSVTSGLNVVKVGELVDQQILKLLETLPLGVELHPIYRQHQVVSNAINTFFRNLMLSVATVVGALCLFMGWRAGTVVGSILLLTVLGTIAFLSPQWLGRAPVRPEVGNLSSLIGVPRLLGNTMDVLVHAQFPAMAFLFLFLLLRILLRRQWLAGAVLFALFLALSILTDDNPWITGALVAVSFPLVLFTLTRFGLLAMTVMFYFFGLIGDTPWTSDVTAWHAGPTIFTLVVMVGIVAYGFYLSLAGRPLVSADLFRE